MDNKYKKILPEEVFITYFKREPSEAEQLIGVSAVEFNGNRLTENDFMNLFARLLHEHGHKTIKFYAGIMGVKPKELQICIKAMSGILANEWVWRYLHLASRELLRETEMSMGEVAKALGFSSLNTFTRYFHRMEGVFPREYSRSKRGGK